MSAEATGGDRVGEARRRAAAMATGPCRCGSMRTAKDCCFDGRRWHKPSAILGLHALPKISSLDGCYMKSLGSCDKGISGEHLISKSVILLLQGQGEFTVSGLPWLPEGEAKAIGPNSLTANCLCEKHNSALHPLDDAALAFFAAVKAGLERDAGSEHFLISGHDLERWLLKTIKAMAASKNLSVNRQRLSGAFASDIAVLEMLDHPTRWPKGAGLYCPMLIGETTQNHSRFQLQPFVTEADEVYGLGVNILGLDFMLILGEPDLGRSATLQSARFRPGKITITHPGGVNEIALSWEDARAHDDNLTLQFVRPALAA